MGRAVNQSGPGKPLRSRSVTGIIAPSYSSREWSNARMVWKAVKASKAARRSSRRCARRSGWSGSSEVLKPTAG